jgi:hypothetical protein
MGNGKTEQEWFSEDDGEGRAMNLLDKLSRWAAKREKRRTENEKAVRAALERVLTQYGKFGVISPTSYEQARQALGTGWDWWHKITGKVPYEFVDTVPRVSYEMMVGTVERYQSMLEEAQNRIQELQGKDGKEEDGKNSG